MAYLSEDKITGTVLVNLHSDGLAIYNNTSIKRNIEKSQIYFVDRPVSTDVTKFSKGSILNEFCIPIGEDISGDFTFSVWQYYIDGDNCMTTIGSYVPGRYPIEVNEYYRIGIDYINKYSIRCKIETRDNYETTDYTSPKPIANAWHHYAVCHSNNMLYWFFDGELLKSLDVSDSKYQNYFTNHGLYKMYIQAGGKWDGRGNIYMDDIVVIKDQCLWTKKFTSPTDALVGNSHKYIQKLYPYPSINENDRLKMY